MNERVKKNPVVLLLILTLSAACFGQADVPNEDSAELKENIEGKPEELPPGFKSDGCTLFPDGNYRECCVKHDIDYYQGGSLKERRRSDKRLYRCVKKKKGWQNKFLAPLIFIGVRIGGVSFLPTPFRWGFGRKKIKRLKKAGEVEKAKENSRKQTPGHSPKKKLKTKSETTTSERNGAPITTPSLRDAPPS